MDLKVYYRKLRETESSLEAVDVVVVSLPTPDGGKEGVASEVPRGVAAKLIVNGQARLATKEEAERFYQDAARARKAAEQAAMAERIQVTVVTDPEGARLPNAARGSKGQGSPGKA